MKFFAPAAFWLLSLLGVVIVMYLLKRKRVVRLVSSTLLWQRFLAETQASAPFQRLRHNWLLILQLILLTLAIFALARPYFPSDAKPSRLSVLILDGSASMKAVDESPSRFEKARRLARKWIDGMRDEDQMMLLLAAGHTEVKQSATSDKTALKRALDSCEPADSPSRLAESFKLAETLVRDKPDAEVHLFSDGALADMEGFQNQSLPLVFHKVGERANNAGIINLDLRPNPENPAQRAVFVSLGNYSTNQLEGELELSLDGTLLQVRPITMGARETMGEIFIAEQQRDGIFSVRLKAADDLEADNIAQVFSRMPQVMNVLLVTQGNRLLERALRVLPEVHLQVKGSLSDPAEEFDLVVLDNVEPAVWPGKNILAFHVQKPEWFSSIDVVKSPPLVNWRASHPLLRYVGFDNVYIRESIAIKSPEWGVSLLDSPQNSLMVAGERGRQRVVWSGFDVLESDWIFRVSFPIFIANAVDWLNPANLLSSHLMVKAGEAFRWPLPGEIREVEVEFPGSQRRKFLLEPGTSEFVFGDTLRQGVYRLEAGTNIVQFCVNLLNANESDTTPRPELPFDQFGNVRATSVQRANMEIWRWVAMMALGVLLFEWWFYHRRTA